MSDEVIVVNRDTLDEHRKTYPVYIYDHIARTYEKYTKDKWVLIYNGVDGSTQCDIMPRYDPSVIEIDNCDTFSTREVFDTAFHRFKTAFAEVC